MLLRQAAAERAGYPCDRERRESAARGGGRPARRIAGGHPRERTGVCDVPRHLRGQSGVERAGCRPVPVHRAARRRPARERPHPAGRLSVAALLCPQCGCRTVWTAVVDAVAVGVPHQSGSFYPAHVESGVDARVRVCQLAADVRVRAGAAALLGHNARQVDLRAVRPR